MQQILSLQQHANLKLTPNAVAKYAAKHHLLKVEAVEIPQIASFAPVVLTKDPQSGEFVFVALCSLQPGKNSFVNNNQWQAGYQPLGLQCFPLYLVKSAEQQGYAIAFDDNAEYVNEQQGEVFFEQDKASNMLNEKTRLLQQNSQNMAQSFKVIKMLEQMQLLKAVDLVLQYQTGNSQTIQGLWTIDEQKLNQLSAEQLKQLQQQGILMLLHAMLLSLHQVNQLVRSYNANNSDQLSHVAIEVAKERQL